MKFVRFILCLVMVACFALPAMAQDENISIHSKTDQLIEKAKQVPSLWSQNVDTLRSQKEFCKQVVSGNIANKYQIHKNREEIIKAIKLSAERRDEAFISFNELFRYAMYNYKTTDYQMCMEGLFFNPAPFKNSCSFIGATTRFAMGLSSAYPNFLKAIENGEYQVKEKVKEKAKSI